MYSAFLITPKLLCQAVVYQAQDSQRGQCQAGICYQDYRDTKVQKCQTTGLAITLVMDIAKPTYFGPTEGVGRRGACSGACPLSPFFFPSLLLITSS